MRVVDDTLYRFAVTLGVAVEPGEVDVAVQRVRYAGAPDGVGRMPPVVESAWFALGLKLPRLELPPQPQECLRWPDTAHHRCTYARQHVGLPGEAQLRIECGELWEAFLQLRALPLLAGLGFSAPRDVRDEPPLFPLDGVLADGLLRRVRAPLAERSGLPPSWYARLCSGAPMSVR